MNCVSKFFRKMFGYKDCTKNASTCEKEVCCMTKEVEVEEQKMELITDVTASAPLTMVKEVVIEEVNVEFVKKPRRKYNKKPKTEVTDKKEAKPKKNKKDDK